MGNNLPSKRKQIIDTIIGFVVLAILIIFGVLLLKWFVTKLIKGLVTLKEVASHLDAVIIVALITGSVSIVGVVISSVLGKIIDYNKSRKEYLAKKREQPYEGFIEMFYGIVDSNKNEKEYSQEKMIEDMQGFSKQLTLWGSKRVVRKWVDFRKSAAYSDPKTVISSLEDIMNEMRKDMRVGKLEKWALIRMFINDIDDKGNVVDTTGNH